MEQHLPQVCAAKPPPNLACDGDEGHWPVAADGPAYAGAMVSQTDAGMPRRLLLVHHTPSPGMQAMLEAVLAGARDEEIEGVEVVVRPALIASVVDVLEADAGLQRIDIDADAPHREHVERLGAEQSHRSHFA